MSLWSWFRREPREEPITYVAQEVDPVHAYLVGIAISQHGVLVRTDLVGPLFAYNASDVMAQAVLEYATEHPEIKGSVRIVAVAPATVFEVGRLGDLLKSEWVRQMPTMGMVA